MNLVHVSLQFLGNWRIISNSKKSIKSGILLGSVSKYVAFSVDNSDVLFYPHDFGLFYAFIHQLLWGYCRVYCLESCFAMVVYIGIFVLCITFPDRYCSCCNCSDFCLENRSIFFYKGRYFHFWIQTECFRKVIPFVSDPLL